MSIQTFDVTVEREGRWWVFDIPRLGTGGQARSLEEVDREAQGVAAMWLLAEWVAAEHDEAEARRAQARAAERRRAVVTALRADYTAPDVGRVLGISKQRVYQIEKAKAS